MAIIKNADGTVGNTLSANKFMMDNNLQAKYRLLQSYSNKKELKKLKNVDGIGKDSSLKKDVKEVADTTSPNILNFLSKIQSFQFGPPSDNLWTVEILAEQRGTNESGKLTVLYENILNVNLNWSNMIGTRWKIDLEQPTRTSKNESLKYIEQFTGKSGVFLAQEVRFTPMSVNIIDTPWASVSNNNMFFNFGNIAAGRSESKSLKISFLISNWDIGDILFDPWISAVAQKGLIEDDEDKTIKAKIIVREYSHGMPKEYIGNKSLEAMECRKEYIFHDCVPVSRDEVSKNYEFSTAGTFKKSVIDFRFEDYEIHYKY